MALDDVVKRSYDIIIQAETKLALDQKNEEWTKQSLIVPVLEELGWHAAFEIYPEARPEGAEGWIDYLCKPQQPGAKSMCIEAKALKRSAPTGKDAPEIVKGLSQSKQRGASYFVWTNGDTWQIFALALKEAPVYQITIGSTGGEEAKIRASSQKLAVLRKEQFRSDAIEDAIRVHWRKTALPAALDAVLHERPSKLVAVMKEALPAALNITDGEILNYLATCKVEGEEIPIPPWRVQVWTPEEWEKLVTSDEPRYDKTRRKLLKGERRQLAEYLVSADYDPWLSTTTARLLGHKRSERTKGITGTAVRFYKEVGFIRPQDPSEKRRHRIRYERVDEAVPFIERLLQPLVRK